MHLTINSKAIGQLRLKCAPEVRPTKSIVRQAIADTLRPYLPNLDCIDFFAGSGAVGITLLTAGAQGCIFVEANRHVFATLQANIAILQSNITKHGHPPKQITTYHQNVANFLRHFNTTAPILVWADPPWDATHWRQTLPNQLQVASGSYLAIESARHHYNPINHHGWIVQKLQNYGNTTLEVLRKE